MVTPLPQSTERVLGFKLSGKLHDEDYQHFVPALEAAIQKHGKVRMLAHFEDFHGWDLHALWDDTKFSTKHCTDIEKLALVGDKSWEKWMAVVCKPFTMAKVEYFDVADIDRAWAWLAE
ncbi:MAG: STAS/SEC14 domain-containing protein [Chthoniobacteraceae bacterium]